MGEPATTAAGLVVYALDLARMRAFYVEVLGAVPTHGDATHAALALGGFELVVHAIPAEHAAGIVVTAPPAPREEQALKPTFALGAGLAALDGFEARVIAWGGCLLGPRWPRGAGLVRGFCDPEGNVLQVSVG